MGKLPELSDGLLYLAVFCGATIAALIGYFKKPKSTSSDPVLTSIGLEYGLREQQERLIAETKRCADALTDIAKILGDSKTESINDRLEDQTKSLEGLARTVESLLTRATTMESHLIKERSNRSR